MDEPTKPEVGDPTTLDGVKDKYSLKKFDPVQARELSPQEKEDFMLLPEVKGSETPSLSQFFNRTVSEFKDVDCSDDDLAEYQSLTETDGVVGRSATLTDYLIARTFQHVVQERYMLEFTIAQLAQIRVDLKQAKRFVGYNQYRPFFNLLHTRASGTKTGKVDANSALDDVLLIIKHLSPIVADSRTPEDTKEFLSTHGSDKLMILRMVRRSFYELTTTYQDYIYDREFGRKTLEERFPAFAFAWEPMFGENVNITRINVAAQLKLIEWIDMAVASLP